MSVLKSKRKSSQFEVFHHLYKTRKEVTDLLLRDFGYDLERAEKKVEKMFGGRRYEELTPEEKVRYDKLKAKNEAFDTWFIEDEGQMLKGLGHDRICYLGSCYIKQGYITKDDYENLHDYLYLPYKKLGGNGTAEKIMKEVDKLPLTDKEEEQNE